MKNKMPTIIVEFPIDTKSETNMREHWSATHRRRKIQRRDAKTLCALHLHGFKIPPNKKILIELMRMAPRKLDDDNLRSALKAVRDGIADYFKVNDNSESIIWDYSQMYIAKIRSVVMSITVLDD